MPEPLVSVAEMREREARTWAAGTSQESVIRRAGMEVARFVERWTRPQDPGLALAGSGHNGDDTVVAEHHLPDRDIEVLRFHDPASFGAALQWLADHRGDPRAFILDGLFGIGLNRPLEGHWLHLVQAINVAGLRVFSVDVPSGLNADTGEPQGAAVHATATITLGAVKRGLVLPKAAAFVGRLELARDIGLLPSERADALEAWTVASDFAGFPAPRRADSHKGHHGHVAVIAGSLGYHGAAVLALQGALRSRPGLVTAYVDERCYLPVASQARAAMVHPWKGGPIHDESFTAIVAGPGLASPGLSPAVRAEVKRLWRSARCAVLIDASALDWVRDESLEGTPGPRIITPHPGEAARLLRRTAAEVESDRPRAVRELAGLWSGGDVQVVLKGRHTLVGTRTGPLFHNSSGNPGLAQGGSGDVLAGHLGGLLAQPALVQGLSRTIRYGVWHHGAVADALELEGNRWTTEDLVEALGRTL